MTWEEDINRELQVVQGLVIESEEQGAKRERERIIALLESKDEWHYAFSDVSDVIALIKGEHK